MTAGPDSAPLTKTPCGDGCRPGWLGAPTKLGKRPKGSLFLVILPKSRTGIGLLGDSKKWGLGPIEADYRRRRPILQIQHHQRFHRAPRSLPDSGGLVLDAGAEQDRRWGKAIREPACAPVSRQAQELMRGREGDGVRLVCRAVVISRQPPVPCWISSGGRG